jgi:hypothetical protein
MEMTRETEVNRYPKNDIPQGQQMVMVTLSRELGEERDDDEQLMGLGMYRGEKGSVCLWLAPRWDAAAALAARGKNATQKNGAGRRVVVQARRGIDTYREMRLSTSLARVDNEMGNSDIRVGGGELAELYMWLG